jgi:hypothetical protein
MRHLLYLTVILSLVTSTLVGQQYVVNETIPSSGTSNVALMTTLSVTFDAALDTELILEVIDDVEDSIVVLPYE